jgi:hypothetical protein
MKPTINPSGCLTAACVMTRRGLLGRLAAAVSALAVIPLRPLSFGTASPPEGRPVVSFHLDRPYLDWSGMAIPYHPPLGARSAEVAAHLTEEMLRRTSIST